MHVDNARITLGLAIAAGSTQWLAWVSMDQLASWNPPPRGLCRLSGNSPEASHLYREVLGDHLADPMWGS